MFHFLSDFSGPAVSSSEQNVEERGNLPRQSVEKKKRGRPKKSLEVGDKPQNPSQDDNPLITKCEPMEEDTEQRKRRRTSRPVEEVHDGTLNSDIQDENSLSEDGKQQSNAKVVTGKRGRRKAAATSSANSDNGEVENSRRKRKDDDSTENDNPIGVGNDNDESDEEVVVKKGAKQKKPATSNKKDSAQQIPEVEEDAADLSKIIKCACCKEEMQSKDFTKHNFAKHNNIGWMDGDPPTDLYDERSLMTILKRVLKQTKKKFLVCDTCGVEKKSCLGYITHKRVCGKSVEERYSMQVTCELCGRKMMPVSMKSHMASHARSKLDGLIIETGRKRVAASKAKSKLSEFLNEDGTARPLITPVRKKLLFTSPKPRKAPSKFIGKWRAELLANNPAKCFNVDCPFETDNVETMKEHFKVCDFAEQSTTTYDCLVCAFKSEDENTIREHVATVHSQGSEENAVEIIDSGSDVDLKDSDDAASEEFESDDEESDRRIRVRPFMTKSKRPCHRFRFLAKEDLNRSSALSTFTPSLMWTLQYRMENDSPSLFHEFLSTEEDWQLVPVSEIEQYLPAAKTSVHVAFGDPENGIRFNLFDSTVVDDSGVIFVGGPVWASAWCPLPLDLSVKYNTEVSQFLAVSCHREMDQFHGIYSCYTGPNMIQLWDVGPLNNTESPMVPKLALAIVHDFGSVWRLEWCPSGAYGSWVNGKLRRLGLLAAACSDGFVHLFSVCFPTELKPNQTPIYRCKPVLTLKPNSPELTQCTRVSWHRVKGHGLIAGGYCDGKVALWNLENYSSLLYNKEDREMYPYHTFHAHYSVVSALSLSPEGQYLMTGSRDCSVKFWNLEDTNAPVTVNRKGLVTDGAWLSHWMCAMTTYDDAYLHEHSNATLIPIREFGYKPYPVLPQNSVAWCLSESAWLNSLVQGSSAGEVALNIAGQLFLGLDNEKFPTRKRLLVCSTELRDLIQDSDGKEILGAETAKPSQVKEGGKSNDKAKEKNDKSKSKKSGKTKDKKNDKAKDITIDEDNDKDIEEIPVENADTTSTNVDLKPRDYKDTIDKYGINIVNFLNFKTDHIPPEVTQPMRQSNAMNQVHSEMYPITSINQVQWNPNLKSCLWLAVGHQCGLMRLVCLKYMHSTTLSRFYSKAEAVLKRAHS